jgi:hypothetical protein
MLSTHMHRPNAPTSTMYCLWWSPVRSNRSTMWFCCIHAHRSCSTHTTSTASHTECDPAPQSTCSAISHAAWHLTRKPMCFTSCSVAPTVQQSSQLATYTIILALQYCAAVEVLQCQLHETRQTDKDKDEPC